MGQRFAPPTDATITLGTNTAGSFPVYIQLLGPSGKDMQYRSAVLVYLSKDATGDTLSVDTTDSTDMDILTDGTLIKEHTTDVVQTILSEADGDIGLTVVVANAKSVWVNVVLPNGRIVTSDEITYTAP